MARPTKLTRRVQEKICAAISIGAHRELAARYAGICPDTFYNWLERGRKERARRQAGEPPNESETPFCQFSDAVEDAEANAGISWAQVVDKAAQTDPAWAWRMLKLRFPEGFHEESRLEISGPNGGHIPIRFDREHVLSELAEPASGSGGDRLPQGADQGGS